MARGLSIAALILSIILPFVGLILGIVALRRERRDGESGTLAIVAIVIGALGTILFAFVVFGAAIAAFGVFNPQRFTQERCIGDSTKFACTSNAVATDVLSDSVALEFSNGAGETVLITGVSVDGSCGEVVSATIDGVQLPVELAPNEDAVLEVVCLEGAVRAGSTFEDTFTIGYESNGITGLRGPIEVVVKT